MRRRVAERGGRRPGAGRGSARTTRARRALGRALRFAAAAVVAVAATAAGRPVLAQEMGAALLKGLDAEQAGKLNDAVAAYRDAMTGPQLVQAVLGLERVYVLLGRQDSLLALLDRTLRERPADPALRAAQVRTLLGQGRRDEAAQVFERWLSAAPGDPQPWREYARQLLDQGRASAADSVLGRAQRVLGGGREVAAELGQLRATLGLWEPAAEAWRTAVRDAPWLLQAASFALAPTPAAQRVNVQRVFMRRPAEATARRVAAALALGWGAPRDAWAALRELPGNDSTAVAWLDFADQAEALGEWSIAREAMISALAVRPSSTVALRAANASVRAGDPRMALDLAELAARGLDSAALAQRVLPVRVRALAALGKPQDAEALVAAHGAWIDPVTRRRASGLIARGWVMAGDLPRAKAALVAAGADGDDDQVAGWVALYGGDLAGARRELKRSGESNGDAVSALSLLARTRAEHAPRVGAAFLALARGDTAAATAGFVDGAGEIPEAAPLLLGLSARLYAARKDDPKAVALWTRIVTDYPQAPEAPEADLEWARALRRKGTDAGAIQRLEHLILTWPASALVPQARRELELLRQRVPST